MVNRWKSPASVTRSHSCSRSRAKREGQERVVLRQKLCLSLLAQALLAGGLLGGASSAIAQEEEQPRIGDQETRKTPAMREKVYQPLSEAQACAEMEDMQCATQLLERVRAMTDLNSYELAQMWNFYAFIHFSQDNFAEAITAYENVLKQ